MFIYLLLISLVSSALINQNAQVINNFAVSNLNSNELRISSVSSTVTTSNDTCQTYNGLICTKCKNSYTLTNGKCYQSVLNCLQQFMNICTQCKTNYYSSVSVQPNTQNQITVTCAPINSTNSSPNTTNSINSTNTTVQNPIILLGKQTFISWEPVQVRFPTDVYLVMIWNYLDGNQDLKQKFKISQNTLESAVQGKIKPGTNNITLLNWVLINQFTNFVEGHLIDIYNVFFYRFRFLNQVSKNQYQVLAMIHQNNFQIDLLQQIKINNGTNNGTVSNNGTAMGNSTQNALNQKIKSLQQQILDLKLYSNKQRKLSEQRQIQILLFQGYSLMLPEMINVDVGCNIIQRYFQSNFTDFLNIIEPDPDQNVYTWLNFQINQLYFRKLSITRQYVYSISFTDQVKILAVFVLNRGFEIQTVKKICNR